MAEAIGLSAASFMWVVYAQFEPTPVEHAIDMAVAGVGVIIALATYYILKEIRK